MCYLKGIERKRRIAVDISTDKWMIHEADSAVLLYSGRVVHCFVLKLPLLWWRLLSADNPRPLTSLDLEFDKIVKG